MKGARASFDVRSNAIGGDLLLFGTGGVPTRGGEAVVAMIARGVERGVID